MDEIPLCPDYWPRLLWQRVLHWHIPDPGPIDRQLIAELDAHFAALGVLALSNRLNDAKASEEIARVTARLASNPMPGVTRLVQQRS